jgi:hypothetical protein
MYELLGGNQAFLQKPVEASRKGVLSKFNKNGIMRP